MTPAMIELHWLPVHLKDRIQAVTADAFCYCILLLSVAVPATSVILLRPLLHHLANKDYIPLLILSPTQSHPLSPSLENACFFVAGPSA